MNDYVSMPNRGTAKGASGPRKFKFPEKGRIRIALAVIVFIIVIAKITGPCGGGKKTSAVGTIDTAGTVDKINTNNAIKKDKAAKKKSADTDKTADNKKFDVDPKNTLTDKIANAVGTDNVASTVDAKINKKADAKKGVPDNGITFVELRQLVREYKIGVSASRQQIVIPASGENSKGLFGFGKGRDGGDTLSVALSIDTTLRKYAASMFRQYRPRYAAVAVVDPSSGRVLALVSYAGDSAEMDGKELYLRNCFPAASVFKTIVAAAGIERGGMHGKTTIEHFGRNHTLYTTQLQRELKVSRDITLEDAYAYSINPVFARIALFNINKDVVVEYGRRFGFNESVPFEYDVDASEMFAPDTGFSVAEFASGFNRKTTITPIFGALLAAAVCEGGVIFEPTLIDTVRSLRGDSCLYVRKTKIWRRAVKEATAVELRGLMENVTRYGTARHTFRQLRESPRYNAFEFGGKTGSVNQMGLGRVDWFVGFARNPTNKNQRIAVGVVTTHGDYWTVHSSYIAAELIKKHISNQSSSKSKTTPTI